jgi:hypothetical protein
MFATYCAACHAVVEWTRDGEFYYGLCLWCGYEPEPKPVLHLPPVPRMQEDKAYADDTREGQALPPVPQSSERPA